MIKHDPTCLNILFFGNRRWSQIIPPKCHKPFPMIVPSHHITWKNTLNPIEPLWYPSIPMYSYVKIQTCTAMIAGILHILHNIYIYTVYIIIFIIIIIIVIYIYIIISIVACGPHCKEVPCSSSQSPQIPKPKAHPSMVWVFPLPVCPAELGRKGSLGRSWKKIC